VTNTDWSQWHDAYARPESGLADRLDAVQRATRARPLGPHGQQLDADRRVGPFVYHFEVATGVDEAPFVSGTVPEGIGKTSWILPASLPIGLMLHWRVWAEDAATGVISDAGGAQFMVAQRASGLYALEVRGPSGCQGPFVISGAVAGTTTDQVFRVTTSGTLTLDLTTAGADLAGSIGGSAQSYSFSGSDPSGGAPALATRNGDGTISGSLDGKLSYYPNGIGRSCTGTFTWTLQPI